MWRMLQSRPFGVPAKGNCYEANESCANNVERGSVSSEYADEKKAAALLPTFNLFMLTMLHEARASFLLIINLAASEILQDTTL